MGDIPRWRGQGVDFAAISFLPTGNPSVIVPATHR
jgi:hypothetical protein